MPPPRRSEQCYARRSTKLKTKFSKDGRKNERSERRTNISGNHAFRFVCERYRLLRGADATKGFTLAEVLITLGIIGVVSALVMPAIIQNHKKKVAVTQLKATYSILSQAVNLSITENSEIESWNFSLNNIEFAKKYILPYLKVVETKDKYGSAWSLTTLSTQYGYHSGYLFWNNGIPNCPIYILANGSAFNVTNKYISVDINGKKGPNVLGIDGFVFYLDTKRNQLLPYGFGKSKNVLLGKQWGSDGACVRDSSWQYYRGMACASVIIMDGWEITKDYPWGNGGKTPLPPKE